VSAASQRLRIKGGTFEALTAASAGAAAMWGHQQESLKCDGPSARFTRAVKGRGIPLRWYSLLGTPTQQRTDATHLLVQRGSPYECFAVVSRSKFDGGVTVENAVH